MPKQLAARPRLAAKAVLADNRGLSDPCCRMLRTAALRGPGLGWVRQHTRRHRRSNGCTRHTGAALKR
ncbi:hypothetical protein ABB27_01835 [Stenotrophomonas terrae]|uniref:Uncharacterized protein n=1 Tax=Stenotrophomonas terrae TaxID=405446 RepID=A0A0R0CS32_9GAMM|nr:hypothetical protein ABB27_01835 [Stenotrophomonas terrae]